MELTTVGKYLKQKGGSCDASQQRPFHNNDFKENNFALRRLLKEIQGVSDVKLYHIYLENTWEFKKILKVVFYQFDWYLLWLKKIQEGNESLVTYWCKDQCRFLQTSSYIYKKKKINLAKIVSGKNRTEHDPSSDENSKAQLRQINCNPQKQEKWQD